MPPRSIAPGNPPLAYRTSRNPAWDSSYAARSACESVTSRTPDPSRAGATLRSPPLTSMSTTVFLPSTAPRHCSTKFGLRTLSPPLMEMAKPTARRRTLGSGMAYGQLMDGGTRHSENSRLWRTSTSATEGSAAKARRLSGSTARTPMRLSSACISGHLGEPAPWPGTTSADVRGGELAAPPPTPPREPKNARGGAGRRRGGDRRVDVDVEADAGVDARAATCAWTARVDACIVAVERVARSGGGCRDERTTEAGEGGATTGGRRVE